MAYHNQIAITLTGMLKNIRPPSFGLSLFLAGMYLMYFLPLLFPAARGEGMIAGTWRYHFLARILVGTGAFMEAAANGFEVSRRHPAWTMSGVIALVFMPTMSFVNGAVILDVISRQHAFLWLLFVPNIIMRPANVPWLLLTFFFHALFGSIHGLHEIFVIGRASRQALLFGDTYGFVGTGLYSVSFLLLLLPILRGRLFAGIAIGAYLTRCIQSFVAAKRFAVLLIPVELTMLLYCAYKSQRISKDKLLKIAIGLFIFSLGIAIHSASGPGPQPTQRERNSDAIMASAANEFHQRMTKDGDVATTITTNERWTDAKAALSIMTWMDWLVGKGTVSTAYADGMVNPGVIHNSYLNALFWGGIPLFVFFLTPLFWAIRLLLRSNSTIDLAAASFMLIRYINFPAAVSYTDTIWWLFFCLIVGRVAWSEAALSLVAQRCGGMSLPKAIYGKSRSASKDEY